MDLIRFMISSFCTASVNAGEKKLAFIAGEKCCEPPVAESRRNERNKMR
jgi:hypothetical protein